MIRGIVLAGVLALAACTTSTHPDPPNAPAGTAVIPAVYPGEWFGALRQELLDEGFTGITFVGSVDFASVCSRTANQACRDLHVVDVADQGQRVPVTHRVTVTVQEGP